MKIKLTFLALLGSATALAAAPLTAPTAVHTKPDASSPAVTVLNAGTNPVIASDTAGSPPAGWLAVELPGPFEVYVENKDLLKNLDVRPGASLYLAPEHNAGVLTAFQPGDQATITGLHGKWTQLRLAKKLTGYIHPGADDVAASSPSSPVPAAPVAAAPNATPPGQPAPAANVGSSQGTELPRFFQGKFVSTRSRFHPRRPYDWALEDAAGQRVAYLDISKLLLTDQIENYVGHTVVAYGSAAAVPNTRDIVIAVERLQLQ